MKSKKENLSQSSISKNGKIESFMHLEDSEIINKPLSERRPNNIKMENEESKIIMLFRKNKNYYTSFEFEKTTISAER